jgi:hypothetical protein
MIHDSGSRQQNRSVPNLLFLCRWSQGNEMQIDDDFDAFGIMTPALPGQSRSSVAATLGLPPHYSYLCVAAQNEV